MSFIRINHVYSLVLLLSFVSAFVLPGVSDGWPGASNRMAAHVRGLFAPVSLPFHRIATWTHAAFFASAPIDTRPEAEIRQENDYLKTELARLTKQLEILQEINLDREKLGTLREDSIPMAVVGTDSGNRETLLLRPRLDVQL